MTLKQINPYTRSRIYKISSPGTYPSYHSHLKHARDCSDRRKALGYADTKITVERARAVRFSTEY